jgi:hypothetical protein
VFNSPVHCGPFEPNDARQHAFQRAQQEHSLVESVDVCALTDQQFDHGHLPFGSCIVKGRGAPPAAACVKSCAHSKCGISARPRSRCTSSQQHSNAIRMFLALGHFQRSTREYVDVRLHLHKSFDTCRLVVFSSPMQCSPSVPDDARVSMHSSARNKHSKSSPDIKAPARTHYTNACSHSHTNNVLGIIHRNTNHHLHLHHHNQHH